MTREEALKIWLPVIKMGVESIPECSEALDMAIKALEQGSVLDKIKAEIEELPNTYYFGKFGAYTNRDDINKIIDKYRGESEE